MANFNKVILAGNLTKDPELKYTPQGTAVVNLRLAINRKYKNAAGELKEDACFTTAVVWGKTAENCAQYLAKGSSVLVEGRLQTRSWEKDGEKRFVTEVVAENVQFLGKKPEAKAEEKTSEQDWLEEEDADKGPKPKEQVAEGEQF